MKAKPSELLIDALQALRECEDDPNYCINMGSWHESVDDNECDVCLAGSVIAKRLHIPAYLSIEAEDFPNNIRDILLAFDNLRSGNIHFAIRRLGYDCEKFPPLPEYISVTDYPHKSDIHEATYEELVDEFHADMDLMVELLEDVGL